VLASGQFATAKSIVNGNTPSVASGEIYVEITASTGMSNYAANGFLDRMFRNQVFTVSATYLALCTATPTDASTGSTITEPSGNNYARKQVNTNGGGAPAWGVVAAGSVVGATATFNTPSGSWGTVTYVAVVDALTVGNMLYYMAVTNQAVALNDVVTVTPTLNQS
jgi:hypothetical protein